MNNMVIHFIKFLHVNSLINVLEKGFENTLKLQRLVHMAQSCFELELGYSFKETRFGPYSGQLNDQYSDLDKNMIADNKKFELPEGFSVDRFVKIFLGKDEQWLRVAALIVYSHKGVDRHDETIEAVCRRLPHLTRDKIVNVFNSLIEYKLITTNNYEYSVAIELCVNFSVP